jgi:ABC-type multidrug transport system fused ATPase/permease subunit
MRKNGAMKGAKEESTHDDAASSNPEKDDEKSVTGGSTSAVNKEENNAQPASLSKLLTLARPEMCMLVFALVLMVVAEATGLLNPLLVARAYDDLVDPLLSPANRMTNINRTMILVLTVHFGGVLLAFVRAAIMGIAGERIVARTRIRLYTSILRQEVAFFDRTKTGELVSRLGSDTAVLQIGTSQALPEVAVGIIKVVASVAVMFWISPKLAALLLAFVFLVMGICIPFGGILGKLSKTYQDVLGRSQTYSTEALGAVRTVQSFAAEEREIDRYRHSIGNPDGYFFWWPTDRKTHCTTYSIGFFKSITTVGLFTVIFGMGFAGMYICLWYGFKLVNDKEITLGQLTAFQSYIFQIGGGLAQTSQFVSKLIEAQGAAARLFFLLERVPAIPKPSEIDNGDDEQPVPPKRLDSIVGAVDFNQVCFSYPSRPDVEVLRNFSLSIPANQTAALVGASGAGKSTVVSLLQRFYDVSSGSITIDGHDIRHLDLHWLRSQIAYVQQEPQLFGLTVRENIAYGMDREVTQKEIEAVAMEANAHEFISQWPDGYETLVGERGIQLSGGQKQRIAIARALLPAPKILLLDEATSALDSESEHLVQEAIDKAVVGRTVIVVAHRLSTVQRANQIVVVDDHQIVDIGSHTELLHRCAKYQDLIKRQSLLNGGS